MTEQPKACEIEIVERRPAGDIGHGDPIVPNEIRINGHPVRAPKNNPVRIHEIQIDGDGEVLVTLALFARLVHIGEEVK